MMRLSKVLREYRWAKRLGFKELAQEIGITPSALTRLEGGKATESSNLTAVFIWLLEDSLEEEVRNAD